MIVKTVSDVKAVIAVYIRLQDVRLDLRTSWWRIKITEWKFVMTSSNRPETSITGFPEPNFFCVL